VASWQAALERVVRERYPRLVAYASFLTHDRAQAEDLVQDAIVATYSGRARFEDDAQAEAYVRRAIASRWVDGQRRRGRESRAVAQVAGRLADATVPAPELTAIEPELQAALAALAPRVRACVVLRHLDDQSVRDTAAALGLSAGAVKRYTADGVAALAAALGVTPPAETVRVAGPTGGGDGE
jgi:RNA polymerase sigma factor (sigma-70 family)